MQPKVLKDDASISKLRAFVHLLNCFAPPDLYFGVENCYFDYGQGWKWTTIIRYDQTQEGSVLGKCQCVDPATWERILLAEKPSDFLALCEQVLYKKKERK